MKGFTLIELMIAISIIAIISSIGLISYSQAQALGRDAKRKQDLRSVAVALELYYQKNKQYPASPNNQWYSKLGPDWIPGMVPLYIDSLPKDPLKDQEDPWREGYYGYSFFSAQCGNYAAGQFYVLSVKLENKNDKDRLENDRNKWCDGTSLTDKGWSGYNFVITSR